MIRYNISVPRKYHKDGEEKTAWSNVGKLIRFDATEEKPEGFIVELLVFEDKPKEEKETDTIL
jgi:hypothetical protein